MNAKSFQELFRPISIGIFLAGLLLFLPGFWWGAPHATAPNLTHSWGVDDESPLGPLAEMHNIYQPKPDRNLGYPLMLSFILSGAYAPYILYLLLSGQLTQVSGVYPFGLVDPVKTLKVLTWIAHFVTVVMGAGIGWAAYHIGRTVWNTSTGLWSALFTLLSFPMFYYSRNANVDVPMLFFSALALLVYADALTYSVTRKHALWFGIFSGFSLATKESALGLFVAVPFIIWWKVVSSKQPGRETPSVSLGQLLLTAVTAFTVAFGVGSGLFIEPSRFFAHVAFTLGKIDKAAHGLSAVAQTYPFTLEGHLSFIQMMAQYPADMATGLGVAMGLGGLGFLAVREPRKFLLIIPGLAYILFMFLAARAAQMRYLMPAMFLFSFCMARGVSLLWETKQPLQRMVMVLVTGLMCGLSLLRGIELTYQMMFDSRYEAGAWLANVTHPGDQIEYFGTPEKLPALKVGVQAEVTVQHPGIHFHPDVGPKAIASITERWRQRRPKIILLIPDLSSGDPWVYNHTLPPAVYQRLVAGDLGYRLEKTIQTPKLFPWLKMPKLDYPTVNPPIRIFVRKDVFVKGTRGQ